MTRDCAATEGKKRGEQLDVTRERQFICPLCGVETDGAKFCPQCGVKLSTKSNCPKCSAEISSGAHFCPECGEKLG